MCGKRIRLKPFPLSTGLGDQPGRVARSMSSSDVGLGVEVDRGKLDQLLLSQPLPPAELDPSCMLTGYQSQPWLVATSLCVPRAAAGHFA